MRGSGAGHGRHPDGDARRSVTSGAETGGWRLHTYAQLGSTSDLVRQLAANSEPEGLAILAKRQTAGRGTSGREWVSPPGNLHLSILLRPSDPARTLPQWSLLAALAVHDSLAPHVGGPARLTLKWPNDVLLDGDKVAGILVEAEATPEGTLRWLCIGIGANLRHAPDLPGRRAASLPAPGPTAVTIAADLLAALDLWRRVRLTEGFAAIRDAWLARGPRHGEHLQVSAPGGSLSGFYEGLGDDGALLLRTGGRVHAIHAGEVRT